MLPQLVRSLAAARMCILPTQYSATFLVRNLNSNANLDYSRYPKLNEDELEETFQRGSGPGGQAVNKTSNCVMLRHLPTNLLIKCHTHRLASRNRIEARRLLLEKLDEHVNGEHSIAAQMKLIDGKKSVERKRRQQKSHEMKKNWKDRESAIVEESTKGTE